LWSLLGRPEHKQSPSTGILAITLALGVCGRVSIYGFGQSGDASECRHYWECPRWGKYYDPKHTFHDWLAEERVRGLWLEAGLVDNGTLYGEGEAGAAAVRNAARIRGPTDYEAARRAWELLQPGPATRSAA